MGLRDISRALAVLGAALAVVGGLGVCCYNLRFFNTNKLYMKQWGGLILKTCLQCAISSGIFGLICALVAGVGLVLIIIGFNPKISSILLIVSAVLYLGELIPEAVALNKYKWGGITGRYIQDVPDTYPLPPTQLPVWRDSVSLISPYGQYVIKRDDELVTYDTNWELEFDKSLATCGNEEAQAKCKSDWDRLRGLFLLSGALVPGSAYVETEEGGYEMVDPSHELFVPDFQKFGLPTEFNDDLGTWTESTCDKFDIGVKSYKGGWSSKAVTDHIRSECKSAFQLKKEQEELRDVQDHKDYQAKVSRKEESGYSSASLSTFNVVNSIFLGIQTFSFVATLIGAILGFLGGSKDEPEP